MQTKALTQRPVAPEEALRFFSDLLAQPLDADNKIILPDLSNSSTNFISRRGMGFDLASPRNSAWGLVTVVTEYVDHHRRARSQDYRLDSAWFGPRIPTQVPSPQSSAHPAATAHLPLSYPDTISQLRPFGRAGGLMPSTREPL